MTSSIGLREQGEEEFRELWEDLDLGLFQATGAGVVVDANRRMASILSIPGSRPASLVGLELASFFASPGEWTVLAERLTAERVVRSPELRLRRPDGAIFWARLTLRSEQGPTGRVTRLSGTVEDMGDELQCSEDSSSVAAEYRAVFEEHPHAMLVCEEGTLRILAVNSACEAQYGVSAAELEAVSLAELHPPGEGQAALAAHREGGNGLVGPIACRHRRRDGATFPVHIVSSPLRFRERAARLVLALDATRGAALERELRLENDRALEATRLKSAFFSNMTYEIRTPLNVILGYGALLRELLHEHEQRDDEVRGQLEGIERASERLLRTVSSIVDASRLESGSLEVRPSEILIGPFVERIVKELHPLAVKRGIELRSLVEDAAAVVRFDEYCLENALLNLVGNAIKFTENGWVRAAVRQGPEGKPYVEVEDTGIGMEASYLSRMFEAFSQEDAGLRRRYEGSGLGLALTRGYVQLNGGRLVVESVKGKGSIFRIHFA